MEVCAPYQLCMKMWSTLREVLKVWLFQLPCYPAWVCTAVAPLGGSRIFLNDHPASSWSDSFPTGGRMGWRGSGGVGALLHPVAVDMSIHTRTDVTFLRLWNFHGYPNERKWLHIFLNFDSSFVSVASWINHFFFTYVIWLSFWSKNIKKLRS